MIFGQTLIDQKYVIEEMNKLIRNINNWKTEHLEEFNDELKEIDDSDVQKTFFDFESPGTENYSYDSISTSSDRKFNWSEACKVDIDFEQLKLQQDAAGLSHKV